MITVHNQLQGEALASCDYVIDLSGISCQRDYVEKFWQVMRGPGFPQDETCVDINPSWDALAENLADVYFSRWGQSTTVGIKGCRSVVALGIHDFVEFIDLLGFSIELSMHYFDESQADGAQRKSAALLSDGLFKVQYRLEIGSVSEHS
jgi:hypothetical protein